MGRPIRRAKRGSISSKVLLPLDAELNKAARARAKSEGVSLSEWIRRAIRAALAK